MRRVVSSRRWTNARGFTFVEILVVSTLLIILASAIMPLAKVTMQRQREGELRRALRDMRTAIDKFKDAADAGMIGAMDLKTGAEGYPPDLETLVEGVSVVNDQSGRKLKFRRIPIDPLTNSTSGDCGPTRTSLIDVMGGQNGLTSTPRRPALLWTEQVPGMVMHSSALRRSFGTGGPCAGTRVDSPHRTVVVIALISLLAAMAVVQYRNSVQKTQEAVLKTNCPHA